MTARNLGVVFGRAFICKLSFIQSSLTFSSATLMRSPDVTREFADMAGKALCVEWLVENALDIFDQVSP